MVLIQRMTWSELDSRIRNDLLDASILLASIITRPYIKLLYRLFVFSLRASKSKQKQSCRKQHHGSR